ncbi:DASH complex subunit DAD3 family protein [Aspergillus saccharolyticus JOP 1030-1]|uniref:DASH complex subunit DAD3 n=1 Tax=Aspergillus saccharolyticus JOP 1030-1 TaxID=1450539 RepID=A0A318ZAP3_9EURO|nr:hypothetical protein BP01DRAFT_424005 [Aspergillus saccharolyticus JOP 1030-1]PYH44511.1 hypothetical protein BP01DRAFT_424005 [Aspergillus saccharolyticus JOP 1030-1]
MSHLTDLASSPAADHLDSNNSPEDLTDNNATSAPASRPKSTSTTNPLLNPANSLVSDLEQEVLDEYARLLGNVNELSTKLADLAGHPSSLTLDGLRHLERKTATVCTLLKASVYSIVLQQGYYDEEEDGMDGGSFVGRY